MLTMSAKTPSLKERYQQLLESKNGMEAQFQRLLGAIDMMEALLEEEKEAKKGAKAKK